ncbi:hypothetical protein [Litoribacterium kuwaitense]|uniref:hypothetical protein n=1 Tax=Litoribacterium kuwaitense TaxID=1398745 RepID=UPI001FE9AD74|nr:hypothetical protein [Litoribacterium kuwaitense]
MKSILAAATLVAGLALLVGCQQVSEGGTLQKSKRTARFLLVLPMNVRMAMKQKTESLRECPLTLLQPFSLI